MNIFGYLCIKGVSNEWVGGKGIIVVGFQASLKYMINDYDGFLVVLCPLCYKMRCTKIFKIHNLVNHQKMFALIQPTG